LFVKGLIKLKEGLSRSRILLQPVRFKWDFVLIIDSEWLEAAQFIVRIILTFLCAVMLNLAYDKKSKNSIRGFLILVALGSALLKLVSSRIFETQPLFAELALFMALILAISILAGAQMLARSAEFLRLLLVTIF